MKQFLKRLAEGVSEEPSSALVCRWPLNIILG